jgi:hypothetical protein
LQQKRVHPRNNIKTRASPKSRQRARSKKIDPIVAQTDLIGYIAREKQVLLLQNLLTSPDTSWQQQFLHHRSKKHRKIVANPTSYNFFYTNIVLLPQIFCVVGQKSIVAFQKHHCSTIFF